ncbi:SusC/RagA family TonB-linked outer membrane protein [uncultured Bacteroides sp.]|uniref:SusC/RagA family TonB-linked outer membrane protein n=1 Tax=uncultured Bacteroides sp. TaxID=162156 RepID=UPI002AA60676|nr:SusC/RagA family TonB-linked outer membrane protein [uncultured Bacteroides sp.]
MSKIVKVFWFFLLLLYSTFSYSQKVAIHGEIIDSEGSALPGVSVMLKHDVGSISDIEGQFSISAAVGDTLTFSYVGFQTKRVRIDRLSEMKVILQESSISIKEVVVTALGIEKKESTIGYSVREVDGKELVKARDPNPITGLAGKVAGLSVGASTEMLRKPNVLLRGDELTLYVVDGVPISSDTWNISPDDIDNYSVLKGPAAAALYGSRAQNGAILITTKKGVKGKKGTVIEFNSSNMFDKGFLAFPRLQDEYGAGENELYAFGDGKGGGLNDNDYDVWGPKFRGQLIPQYDGEYTPDKTWSTVFPGGYTYEGYIKPTPYVARGKNNLQNFLRTGFQTTDNISITKSGEDYSIRTSLSHSYQKSIIPNMSLNITNFNVYASYNINKKFSIDANMNFNYQYTPNYPDVDYGPNSLIYCMSIWTGADWDINDPKIKGIWQDGKVGIQPIFAEYQRYHNPWAMVNYWLRGHDKKDTYGYVTGHYIIDDHLNMSLRTQISTYDLLRTEKMPVWAHPYGRDQNLGDYREDKRRLTDSNTDLQLNYNYMLGNFVQLSGLVGGNLRIFSYNSSFTSTDYLIIPGVYSFSNSLNPIQSNNFSSKMNIFSGYAAMDLDFGKYATLSATARVDKSSAILTSNDTYFYPSISVASLVSDYVKLPEFISSLKIRGSFAAVRGTTTSETIGTAPFNTITALGGSISNNINGYPLDYGSNYQSPYGGPTYELNSLYKLSKQYNNQSSASYSDNQSDPNIKPFNRVSYEEGFDIKMLKNRLALSATAFQYIDGPQILLNDISITSGYTGYYINALKTRKTGLELSLTGTPIQTPGGFNWDVMANWSTYKDVYTKLPEGQDSYRNFFKEGDRTDKLYGTAFYKSKDGQIIHDTAGKPLVMQVDQYLGNLIGKFQWGLSNKFTYKDVFLSFQFDGNVGGVTVDYMHNKTMSGGRNIETVQGSLGVARDLDDQHAGDKTYPGAYIGKGVVVSNNVGIQYDTKTGSITNYDQLQFAPNTTPTHVQDYVSQYYGISEANLMSKTYAKLRELTIGYTLPYKWLAPYKLTKVSVAFVARNLLYLYGDSRFKDVDLDEYNGETSQTSLQSPTTRRFGFNVNVVF